MAGTISQFTEEQRKRIMKCAGLGLTHKMIAAIFDTSENTLRKHCENELYKGFALRMEKVTGMLSDAIDSGDKASLFFYLKCKGEWRETTRTEVTGADGAPFQVVINMVNKSQKAIEKK